MRRQRNDPPEVILKRQKKAHDVSSKCLGYFLEFFYIAMGQSPFNALVNI